MTTEIEQVRRTLQTFRRADVALHDAEARAHEASAQAEQRLRGSLGQIEQQRAQARATPQLIASGLAAVRPFLVSHAIEEPDARPVPTPDGSSALTLLGQRAAAARSAQTELERLQRAIPPLIPIPAGMVKRRLPRLFTNDVETQTLPAFWIGETPVTNKQYGMFLETQQGRVPAPAGWTGGHYAAGADERPVTNVTYEHAMAYCRWAGLQLPSAAQWLRAARGDSLDPYPWGVMPSFLQFTDERSGAGENGAGTSATARERSRYGAYDMLKPTAQWLATPPGSRPHHTTAVGTLDDAITGGSTWAGVRVARGNSTPLTAPKVTYEIPRWSRIGLLVAAMLFVVWVSWRAIDALAGWAEQINAAAAQARLAAEQTATASAAAAIQATTNAQQRATASAVAVQQASTASAVAVQQASTASAVAVQQASTASAVAVQQTARAAEQVATADAVAARQAATVTAVVAERLAAAEAERRAAIEQALATIEWIGVPAANGMPAFLIMRDGVTNAQYAQCVAAGVCSPPGNTTSYDDAVRADHPVTWVTREQARAYAAWIGGSLPTEAQWLRACQGDTERTYPWGDEPPDATRANVDNQVGDTTPVGSYPDGASPYGVLDMAGNVWEWVEPDADADGRYIVRGGAFNHVPADAACDVRIEDPLADFNNGFRVVSSMGADWSPTATARAIGRLATATAVVVERAAAGALAQGQARWIDVPEGNGVAAFRIMLTEVTNAQYAQCVAIGICSPPWDTTSYDDAARSDHPVAWVTREQARAYAAWVGGSLPTEAQWLRACQGDTARTYPWGDEPPDATRANVDNQVGDTTAVGSYPAGASPYGVLDMSGNVWEWVEPDDGSDARAIVRGGSFDYGAADVACGARLESSNPIGNGLIGMRVVISGAASTAEQPTATGTPTPTPVGNDPLVAPASDRVGAAYVVVPEGSGVAAFRIMLTEVTNAQYAQCVAAGVCGVPRDALNYDMPLYANHPVTWVTREQARAYAAWVGGSLPTEAQWLRACQGDTARTYPWGDEPPDATRANVDNQVGDTTAVGSYPAGASPYGVLDMSGNVWEWIEPDDARGGAFIGSAVNVSCSSRRAIADASASSIIGFRVVTLQP
jgi:formylglycine-generating enzyme required for sulfatase activity